MPKFNIYDMELYADKTMSIFGVDTEEYWFAFEVKNLVKEINKLLKVSLMMAEHNAKKEAFVVADKAIRLASKAAEAQNADEIFVLQNEANSLVDILLKMYT